MNAEDKHIQTYLEEAKELLAELEEAVLELETDNSNTELVNRVFRAMHTIKGSGAMFGFDAVAEFTHNVESVLDQVRNGNIPFTKELAGLILAARDEIAYMLFPESSNQGNAESRKEITSALAALLPQNKGEADQCCSKMADKGKDAPKQEKSDHIYRIRFIPGRNTFLCGIDPLALLNELHTLGNLSIIAFTDHIPVLEEIRHDECYWAWDMTLISAAKINAVKDVFIFVEGDSEVIIEEIDALDEDAEPRIGEILISRGDVSPQAVENAVKSQKRIGEILAESGAVPKTKIDSALLEQQAIKQHAERQTSSSVRVASEKLEQLINIVGELVTTQAQLSQITSSNGDPELLVAVERMENLTNELRDCVLQVRMLPIGSTFIRFKRLVRDLSARLGKEVTFVTDGDDTELDKTVIEKINEPLVHLIRNSLDHGIESPGERELAGKPSCGMIRLTAAHAAGEVVISVEDNGRGLDVATLVRKALDKGLISDAKTLSESELLNLVFHPGLSTASAVTGLSGRGVGMDVVRREVESLRGSVEIQSRPGLGTTVTIRLPLTLAIIDGLLIESGREHFIIPLHHVKVCKELTKSDVQKVHGRHIMDFRGNVVPYIRLNEFFHTACDASLPIEQVIIVEVEDSATGLVVDRIIGEKQAVIKPLGRIFKAAEGLSGATILGDGTVALILDVPQLMRSAERDAGVIH